MEKANLNELSIKELVFSLEDIYDLSSRKAVAIKGQVEQGMISVGDYLIIDGNKCMVVAIEKSRNLVNFVTPEDGSIVVCLKGRF